MAVHETDVCIIGGGIPPAMLAGELAGLRAVLLRGRATAERQRRTEPAYGRSALGTVSAGADSAFVQPAGAQGVGGAERHAVRRAADGAQSRAVRRTRKLLRLRHVR